MKILGLFKRNRVASFFFKVKALCIPARFDQKVAVVEDIKCTEKANHQHVQVVNLLHSRQVDVLYSELVNPSRE